MGFELLQVLFIGFLGDDIGNIKDFQGDDTEDLWVQL